jgi:hypothetical protein
MKSPNFTVLDADPRNLGIAARFVSGFPPFDKYEFSDMMKALFHQIDRQTHLVMTIDRDVVGYLGWSRTTDKNAKAWTEDRAGLKWIDSGDAIAVTIMCANDPKNLMALIKKAKTVEPDKNVYWKRFFKDQKKPVARSVLKRNDDASS